jgi:hypothetical protein
MCQRARAVVVTALLLASASARARNPEQPEAAPQPGTTFLDHPPTSAYWFGAEINTVFQAQPGFHALYTGTNSLRPDAEVAVSGLLTVFGAYRIHRTTALLVDAEMAFGTGISTALGLGGFTNLDVVRNPTLSSEPYVSRLEVHQLIPLTREWEINEDRGPFSMFDYVPRHRLELRLGKMSTADLFDINPAGSDSHLQFLNWTVDNNGAYDYPADTRGYTYGLVVEYQGPIIEVRFGELLMPKVANGLEIDFDLAKSHSENLEVEIKYSRRPGWAGTLRVLGYANHANMGSYREAIDAFAVGVDAQPDITAHRHPGASKYGFGLNVIQELAGLLRLFARGGYNDGRNESFAYTEVDDTFEIGADLRGDPWRRPTDKIGVAFVTNGISAVHQEYLRQGGHGFLLGDACNFAELTCPRRATGYLNYAREDIVEIYYNLHIWRGAFVAVDGQFIANPGYNQDRGPAWVFALRGHLEF